MNELGEVRFYPQRKRWPWVVAALLVVAALAGGYWWGSSDDEAAAAEPTATTSSGFVPPRPLRCGPNESKRQGRCVPRTTTTRPPATTPPQLVDQAVLCAQTQGILARRMASGDPPGRFELDFVGSSCDRTATLLSGNRSAAARDAAVKLRGYAVAVAMWNVGQHSGELVPWEGVNAADAAEVWPREVADVAAG